MQLLLTAVIHLLLLLLLGTAEAPQAHLQPHRHPAWWLRPSPTRHTTSQLPTHQQHQFYNAIIAQGQAGYSCKLQLSLALQLVMPFPSNTKPFSPAAPSSSRWVAQPLPHTPHNLSAPPTRKAPAPEAASPSQAEQYAGLKQCCPVTWQGASGLLPRVCGLGRTAGVMCSSRWRAAAAAPAGALLGT
jgi:hypothetical protein